MKSLVLHGFNDLRIEEVPYPKLMPGWVIVKVKVIQPSITEVLLSKGLPTAGSEQVKSLLEKRGSAPLLGHELCGEVVEVSEGVGRLRPGDRVTALGSAPCGVCSFCLRGERDLCRSPVSWMQWPGSRFADYAVVPAEALARVPGNVTDNEAAALQPLSSCVAAVKWADMKLGESVAVLGQGSMGISTMQVARVSGAGLVITTDVREECLKASRQLGADLAVNAVTDDPVKRVMDITDDEGVDVAFETSGGSPILGLSGSSGFTQASRIVKPGGKVVQIAIIPAPLADISGLGGKSLIFPRGEDLKIVEHAISLVSTGRVKLKPLITHVLKGLDSVSEAFEITGNKAKYHALNPSQVEI